MAMSDQQPERAQGQVLHSPICWLKGHTWTDDPFLGDGQECSRCGTFDDPVSFGTFEAFIVGVAFGIVVTITAYAVAIA